jgi:hypothetical protein
MKRMSLALVASAGVFIAVAGSASASTLCLTLKPNGAVKGPETVGGNKCKTGFEKIELPPAAELETLNKILPDITYEASGVGGKPTVRFSGVNVQVVNGEGKTESTNGEGNLVIGYDENPGTQTGSHNLVLGGRQTFTSYGGILGGFLNTITGPYASVSGGRGNTASGSTASVSGGDLNTASADGASVTGGQANQVSGLFASVSGGEENAASGSDASVSGGTANQASQLFASVSGGVENVASGFLASISGGQANHVESTDAWIGGGLTNRTFSTGQTGEEGAGAAIFGGDGVSTDINDDAKP